MITVDQDGVSRLGDRRPATRCAGRSRIRADRRSTRRSRPMAGSSPSASLKPQARSPADRNPGDRLIEPIRIWELASGKEVASPARAHRGLMRPGLLARRPDARLGQRRQRTIGRDRAAGLGRCHRQAAAAFKRPPRRAASRSPTSRTAARSSPPARTARPWSGTSPTWPIAARPSRPTSRRSKPSGPTWRRTTPRGRTGPHGR